MRLRLQTKAERQAWRQATIDHHIKDHAAHVRTVYDLIILTYDQGDKYYLKIWKANGFSNLQRRQIWANQRQYIGRPLVVRYQELTDGGIPRFPVFQKFA